jgi:hypothetical protein
MEANPSVQCSYSSRIRLDRRGAVIATPESNPASSFFRRDIIEEVGYFDSVRIGADSEFEERLRRRWGGQATSTLSEVLTVSSEQAGSLVADGPFALDAFGYNDMQSAYTEAWLRWHQESTAANSLHMPFPQDSRPFPVPAELAVASAVDAFARSDRTDMPASIASQDRIVVHWPMAGKVGRNWGDKLNASLVKSLCGKPVVNSKDPAAVGVDKTYHVIGSALSRAGRRIVWGSGFIASDAKCRRPPRSTKAVRGPLSRNLLLAQGLPCPAVYGDPALLLPLFYAPEIEAVYDVGIIQHFREAGLEPLPSLPVGTSVRLIDITGGIECVVDEILSCRHILSSSLHGIIAAHAYGVPATWIRFSDRPLGDGFKFRDYWASMGRDDVEPVLVNPRAVLDPAIGPATPGDVRVDLFALIKACPFIDAGRKRELVSLARTRSRTARPGSILRIHAGRKRPEASRTQQIAPGQAGAAGLWFSLDSSVWALPGAELDEAVQTGTIAEWLSPESSVWALPGAELDEEGEFPGPR